MFCVPDHCVPKSCATSQRVFCEPFMLNLEVAATPLALAVPGFSGVVNCASVFDAGVPDVHVPARFAAFDVGKSAASPNVLIAVVDTC